MISFKEYLEEAIKTKRQALRDLLTKTKGEDDQIGTHHYLGQDSRPYELSGTHWKMYDYQYNGRDLDTREKIAKSIKTVPLDKIQTQQPRVSRRVVAKKITGSFKKEQKQVPRFPVFMDNGDGTLDMVDGNHRVTARKVRGFEHIRGIVLKRED